MVLQRAICPVASLPEHAEVEAWRGEGKEAVYLNLDAPQTFPAALTGIDRLFLATGYTVAMVHQSKNIVDAAADAGVQFIVHLGIFGNGRITDPHDSAAEAARQSMAASHDMSVGVGSREDEELLSVGSVQATGRTTRQQTGPHRSGP
jgi:uncharacterized protein YbjT (DUF2867 family)